MTADLQYPIGRPNLPESITEALRQEWIALFAQVPAALRKAVEGLSAEQLNTPYRPGGWTVRQLIHHLADSHMNSFLRFRNALTQENPGAQSYSPDAWSGLADAQSAPVELSLTLLAALHERWVILLQSLSAEDFARTVSNADGSSRRLELLLGVYAWHGPHHIAHITGLRERNGW